MAQDEAIINGEYGKLLVKFRNSVQGISSKLNNIKVYNLIIKLKYDISF